MSNKNKKSRVGLGMKPRVPQTQAVETVEANEGADEVSVATGQPKSTLGGVSGPLELVETDGSLAENPVQNLDSATVAAGRVNLTVDESSVVMGLPEGITPETDMGHVTVSSPSYGEKANEMNPETGCISNEGLEELMRKSLEGATVSEPRTNFAVFGMTGFKELPNVAFTEEWFVDPPQMREAKKPTIAELEELMVKTGNNVHIAPDGTVTAYPIGERSDGTFGLVVTIPEGLIEPIRQQAESDGVTAEEWTSTRLQEYLDSWWSAPKGR